MLRCGLVTCAAAMLPQAFGCLAKANVTPTLTLKMKFGINTDVDVILFGILTQLSNPIQ